MNRYRRIPSVSALVAFEATARLGGIGRAAIELNTSQSAISRHVKSLEVQLGTTLFDRVGRNIELNHSGKTYLSVVASALENLNAVTLTLRAAPRNVLIACTHEISHLVLLPIFSALKRKLKDRVNIRIMTCEYDAVPGMIHLGADIVFQYSQCPPGDNAVPIADEQIVPIAAPEFIDRYPVVREAPSERWMNVPCLDLIKRNDGWATWSTWLSGQDRLSSVSVAETFDNYVYLLEAAAAGAGLALGWKGFIERYTVRGALLPVSDSWVKGGATLYAVPTENGALNSDASHFLQALFGLTSAVDNSDADRLER